MIIIYFQSMKTVLDPRKVCRLPWGVGAMQLIDAFMWILVDHTTPLVCGSGQRSINILSGEQFINTLSGQQFIKTLSIDIDVLCLLESRK